MKTKRGTDTHLFGIFDYVSHISWVTGNEVSLCRWRHLHFQHENFRHSFTGELSEVFHVCKETGRQK